MFIRLFKVATLLFTATGFLAAAAPSEACNFEIHLRNKQKNDVKINTARFKIINSNWAANMVSGNNYTIKQDQGKNYDYTPGNCDRIGKFEIQWKCSGHSTHTLTTAFGQDQSDDDSNVIIKFCGCGENNYKESWDTNRTDPATLHNDCPNL